MKLLIFILTFSCISAQARVFNMSEGHFAGYFHGTYWSSSIKNSFLEQESTSTAHSKGFTVNTGGEFGFLYKSNSVSWLFGFELIKPTKISGQATTGANVDYRYSSDISVFAPKVGLEIVLYEEQNFKLLMNGAVGTATLTTKTEYSALTIAPSTDFTVQGKGSDNLLSLGVGGEWHMADNTTFYIQTNYRELKFNKIKYAEAVADSFQGAQPSGATITKIDGSNRKLSLTGIYASIGFRFWLF